MQEMYKKSLQMIKILNVKNKSDYNKLKNYYLLLNIDSLKYMSQKQNFKDIIRLAKES